MFLPPANEVWGKVMVLHLSVSHSVGGVTSCLAAWSHIPSWGLCPWSHVSSEGSLSGGALCRKTPWNQKSGQYISYWNAFLLHLFVYQGGSAIPPGNRHLPPPPEGTWDQTGSDIIPPPQKRTERIILECFLVNCLNCVV